jgi:hypothetical protein
MSLALLSDVGSSNEKMTEHNCSLALNSSSLLLGGASLRAGNSLTTTADDDDDDGAAMELMIDAAVGLAVTLDVFDSEPLDLEGGLFMFNAVFVSLLSAY